MAITVVSFIVLTIMIIAVIAYAPAGDACCVSGIYIGELIFVLLWFGLRYKAGRIGARDLERKRGGY